MKTVIVVYPPGVSTASQIAGGIAGGLAATAVGLALLKVIT